jgi:carbamoyltransferase
LLADGEIVAAAQEERFTRRKQDAGFPARAIRYCLAEAGITPEQLGEIVFYEKPFLTFERLLETYLQFAPQGWRSFVTAMPVWLKEKLFQRRELERSLREAFEYQGKLPPILFSEHHLSHAASAFYPSPFEEAAILCLDGVGEWSTTSAWSGRGEKIESLWEIRFPHSLGLLYSALTYYAGFKVNSGEYKLMGLAPYGRPVYVETILEKLIDVKEDGTFRLALEYFDYCTGLTMTSSKFDALFGGKPRAPEAPLTQKEMDLAASIQEVTELILARLARKLREETGLKNLCLAGGVALNCVANGKLLREKIFDSIWVQPASGDAGAALGCAFAAWHQYAGNPRKSLASRGDRMRGSLLGPSFANERVRRFLERDRIPFEYFRDQELFSRVASELAEGKVVGWFQGRAEFGPRALGSRSILADPRSAEMQSVLNLKIKFRESFRPFAPAILAERTGEYFDLETSSPYMMFVGKIREPRRIPVSSKQWGIELLKLKRSDIPAVTHVDYSARVQTVEAETHPRFHALLKAFEAQTGCPALINTSFNVRGEPIVGTPEDAYRCFMGTELDVLVLENFVLQKRDQPSLDEVKKSGWRRSFELD